MDKQRIQKILTWVGLGLVVVSLAAAFGVDRSLAGGKKVEITSPQGEKLQGTYYPGRLPAGIMLLEGFGSDQVTMTSAASEFARAGVHVLTFDFSGHGRSAGALGFDNAATDRLARQTLAAKEILKQNSGLSDAQILYLGHSLGARVALQSAAMDANPPGGLILIGAQVNLVTNQQAEFFTGTSDSQLEWVRGLDGSHPAADILLISGSWDDILTPQSAQTLLDQLRSGSEAGSFERIWDLVPDLFHNYEIYSPRVLSAAKTWASQVWRLQPGLDASAPAAQTRIWCWLAGLVGFFLLLSGLQGWLTRIWPLELDPAGFRLARLRKFLWSKLALWLAAIPLVGLIFFAALNIPLGIPVFNLIYVGFLGGYGLLLLGLYLLGKTPGVQGKLKLLRPQARADWKRWALAAGFNLILFGLLAAYTRTGWFLSPPVGDRFVWVFLFTPLTMLAFWIGQVEFDLLAVELPGNSRAQWLNALIGFLPFFLWTGLQAGLGSTSGMLGGLQGLVILGLVFLQGRSTRILTGQRWAAALLQSVLLYLLILPQGVLFFSPF